MTEAEAILIATIKTATKEAYKQGMMVGALETQTLKGSENA